MENMTYEELVSNFGQEVADQIQAQIQASQGGGSQAPFTFLKKIAAHGSELGAFGEYVFGIEKEKQADGSMVITDKGTNVGTAFDFIIVNVAYRYRKWDAAANNGKGRTLQSNMFSTLDGIKTAVDAYSGRPLPTSKEAKKEEGWKLVKINAGVIRKNSKAAWEPCIWETDGTLYYTLGELVGNQPNGGLLSGTIHVKTKLDSKGATQFSVIDVENSSFGPLPKDFFTKDPTKGMIRDITEKMTAWREASGYSGSAQPAGATTDAAKPEVESDEAW